MKTHDLLGRPLKAQHHSILGKKFRIPPFTVLNARDGAWQDRKREWLRLGIRSELGRGEHLILTGDVASDYDAYRHRRGDAKTFGSGGPGTLSAQLNDVEKKKGRKPNATIFATGPSTQQLAQKRGYSAMPGGRNAAPTNKSVWLGSNGQPVGGVNSLNSRQSSEVEDTEEGTSQSGTSIFDPVLCEVYYRWFTPAKGFILDPFAGGSCRGITASVLGRNYTGVDLRPEQIEANYIQGKEICREEAQPMWFCGDSRKIDTLGEQFDSIFTCPPYFDLEVYSDDERDLSNTSWDEFCSSYADIIKKSVSLLKNNRFAGVTIGDIRDRQGFYRALPALTTAYFEQAGCRLYNQAILVTAVGSLPVRVARQFVKSRKLGSTHQYVLVFAKGDPVIATNRCEPIDDIAINLMPGLNPEMRYVE